MRPTPVLLVLATMLTLSAPQVVIAQGDAGQQLFLQLKAQLTDPALAAAAPKGFQLAEISLAESSGSDRTAGVRYKIHVVFSTDGKVLPQREGFSYHVFMNPEQAASYVNLPGNQLFGSSPLWPRAANIDPVHVFSMTNAEKQGQRELRCRILSPKIVCLFHEDGSPAVIIVGLHVPALETSNDGARAALLGKLVADPERGAAFLIAARFHLRRALDALIAPAQAK